MAQASGRNADPRYERSGTRQGLLAKPRILLPLLLSTRLRPAAQTLVPAAFCAAVALLLILSGTAHGQAAATSPKGENTPLSTSIQDAASGATTTTTSTGTGSGGIVRTIVGLAIVIAVIYGVTWVLKQIKKRDEDDALGHGLQTAATLPLGPGRALHLVRAGEEFLLLGVTEGSVQHLRTYTESEAREAGFPVDDADEPLRTTPAGATGLVERVRELTVRR